jgi:hypothetical protein
MLDIMLDVSVGAILIFLWFHLSAVAVVASMASAAIGKAGR